MWAGNVSQSWKPRWTSLYCPSYTLSRQGLSLQIKQKFVIILFCVSTTKHVDSKRKITNVWLRIDVILDESKSVKSTPFWACVNACSTKFWARQFNVRKIKTAARQILYIRRHDAENHVGCHKTLVRNRLTTVDSHNESKRCKYRPPVHWTSLWCVKL